MLTPEAISVPMAAWGAVSSVVIAVFSYLGARFVARQSSKATSGTTGVDAQAKATAAWEAYSRRMEERVGSVEARLTEYEARINVLESEREKDLNIIRRLLAHGRLAEAEIVRLEGSIPADDGTIMALATVRVYPPE